MMSKMMTLAVISFFSVHFFHFVSILILSLPRIIAILLVFPAVLFVLLISMLVINKIKLAKNN